MSERHARVTGEALSDKMLACAVSEETLSAKTGIPRQRVIALQKGQARMTAIELYKLCAYFNCPLEEFFVGIFDCRRVYNELPDPVTDESREQLLLAYFRQIPVPSVKDYICGFVKSVAEWEE